MPNALQITDPDSDNPLAQAPAPSFDPRQFGAETEAELSPLELWLAQQRAKNNARGYEPLPGITSGAPPKPWGLDRMQLPQQQPPQSRRSLWGEGIAVTRPADYGVDPRAMILDLGAAASPSFKVWRGGTVLMPPSQDTRLDRGEVSLSPTVPPARTQMRQ